MSNKEYTYDIGKYTIGVDENGEDGIGLTVAKVENGEIYFLGNCHGENARCLDLLIKENQQLKKQLEELRNGYKKKLEKLLSDGIEPDLEDFYLAEIEGKANDYDELLEQQKEFIKYLEDEINEIYRDGGLRQNIYKEILQKYKSIIGELDEKES